MIKSPRLPYHLAFWFQMGISDKYEENELVKLPAS
jgi:hypothetical protein